MKKVKYKIGEHVWTNYYFKTFDGNLNSGYGGKTCEYCSEIISIVNTSLGPVYKLSNKDECYEGHICNFGNPVYDT